MTELNCDRLIGSFVILKLLTGNFRNFKISYFNAFLMVFSIFFINLRRNSKMTALLLLLAYRFSDFFTYFQNNWRIFQLVGVNSDLSSIYPIISAPWIRFDSTSFFSLKIAWKILRHFDFIQNSTTLWRFLSTPIFFPF